MLNKAEHIEAYLKHHSYELTHERRIMIAIIDKMPEFSFRQFKEEAMRNFISKSTVCGFRNILIDARILLPPQTIPARFNVNDIDVEYVLLQEPKKIVTNPYTRTRIEKSYEQNVNQPL